MSQVYEVEAIVGKRQRDGKVEYKVKWVGYSFEECTWEPLRNLKNVRDMIDEYEDKKNGNKEENKPKEKPKEHQEDLSPNEDDKEKVLLGHKRAHEEKEKKEEKDPKNSSNDEEEEAEEGPEVEDDKEPKKKDKIKYLKVISVSKDFTATVLVEHNGVESRITMKTSQLKAVAPVLLVDFYESRIKFTSKKDN